ncbi:glucocorticoid modulatory element-binding protein 2-like [Branchiostoma floridae]|uniref:Glucocorticoid modulatory element-binding protein 2-like n=2 Tax=Branchiostoma floridae TaxID=7739 RepID=A0A9J7HJX1_BRAFL|nr:glucocorticoid modulatory element-binding protein 2-like [Branchiostoma floridae]
MATREAANEDPRSRSPVKSEDGDGEGGDEVAYPVMCGDNQGLLIWKKFICPGIHSRCIKYNGMMRTPKEFVVEAGKAGLKDWKRAIRINGTMIRRMMETGELDYYQHEQVCSKTCRSNRFDVPSGVALQLSLQASGLRPPEFVQTEGQGIPQMVPAERLYAAAAALSASTPRFTPTSPTPVSPEDSLLFWSGIREVGVLDGIFTWIFDALSDLQQCVQHGSCTAEDAQMLTSVLNGLGLMEEVKARLAQQKTEADRQVEEYNRDLQELERQCAERRRQSQALKRRLERLENVLQHTPGRKRARALSPQQGATPKPSSAATAQTNRHLSPEAAPQDLSMKNGHSVSSPLDSSLSSSRSSTPGIHYMNGETNEREDRRGRMVAKSEVNSRSSSR